MYYKYSEFLKNKYGSKVYKLPLNIPVTCPNRDGTVGNSGCIFCGEKGAGFESHSSIIPIKEQLNNNKDYISKKYNCDKFIAYFQNFSNTYIEASKFYENLKEAVQVSGIVGVCISTRPDCVSNEHLDALLKIESEFGVDIYMELGLQTVNYKTLQIVKRGHTLAEFIDAAIRIKSYGFNLGAHIILGLPWDTAQDVIETAKILSVLKVDNVKCHSLFILKDTALGTLFLDGKLKLKTKDEFIDEVLLFLSYLDKGICVQRLLGRAPKEDCLFENWGNSWRKIHDEIVSLMEERKISQGENCDYLIPKVIKRPTS